MKHSLIEFASDRPQPKGTRITYWACAICGTSEIECLEFPECDGIKRTAAQAAKSRKQKSKAAMEATQADMDAFINRLFK